jgi:hypothetical protein
MEVSGAMFRSELALVRVVAFAVVTTASAGVLAAEKAAPSPVADDATTKARAEFVAATDHVKNARWGEALAAFERSAELRPHALTTFNIGACERALGRYTRARVTLAKALVSNEAAGGKELATSFQTDAKKWIEDIDRILVKANVVVRPADAALLVDGAPTAHGKMVLDPGSHVFSVNRPGFSSAVVTKTLEPGSSPEIVLDMQSLPATLKIAADRPGSAVQVDAIDVGVVPVELSRPAGTYTITVKKPGFVTYESKVKVGPGDNPAISASLPEETTPVTKKWWFWTGAALVVAGAAVGTYFLTRPDPERPAPDGGALGWVVTVPSSR